MYTGVQITAPLGIVQVFFDYFSRNSVAV
jgi:hypothetical protein